MASMLARASLLHLEGAVKEVLQDWRFEDDLAAAHQHEAAVALIPVQPRTSVFIIVPEAVPMERQPAARPQQLP